ncbi:MAG: hypothetical protein GYB65_14400 [Chloroflexi bacterium]|nr:hypothetical protein [Chloroflexota bacterium]
MTNDADQVPNPPTDPTLDDDDFEVRTVDTGEFAAIDPEDAVAADAPTIDEVAPAQRLSPEGDEWDDDFTAITVEPELPVRTPDQPRRRATASQRRKARQALRARRRQQQKEIRVWASSLRSLLTISFAAVTISTIFSVWTKPTFLPERFRSELAQVRATQQVLNYQPTDLPTASRPVRIGIIIGHSGPPAGADEGRDPGATCDRSIYPEIPAQFDGWEELTINESVGGRVIDILRADYTQVDRLEEYDDDLLNYEADVLVSIHTNYCLPREGATGFNVASAADVRASPMRGKDDRLLNCMVSQYEEITDLPLHTGTTRDMTEYHAFFKINPVTPAMIIELGFMANDNEILANDPERLAQGVVAGIECYLETEGLAAR